MNRKELISMLLEFSVTNFLSFKETVTLTMVASSISELRETHVFDAGNKINLLTSSAVYGANASGKSNLFKALMFMKWFIRTSSKDTQIGENIDVEPFKLSTLTESQPSCFEMLFVKDNIVYRYGFEVDSKRVHREWLYYIPKTKEINLFNRTGDEFELNRHFPEGIEWTDKTRENALFLSVVAQWKGEISTKVVEWFSNGLSVSSGLRSHYRESIEMLEIKNFKREFLSFIQAADLGIVDMGIEKKQIDFSELPDSLRMLIRDGKDALGEVQQVDIQMIHPKFDEHNKFDSFQKFSLATQESEGTRKIFSILGPVLDGIRSGKTVVIDELDSNLHPILTQALIDCFNSDEANPKHAQLIFNTHDTNLLSYRRLRRDQIWFCEKDRYGASHLYSLVDYSPNKKVRKDEAYEKNYLMGKYGAIPYIGQFNLNSLEEVGDKTGE
ncbi:MAG: ATP-binding protein [Syntrophomonadaceae bacterium]|nr:ATP-binding protein [Syntrophomonadaceae bacterium]